MTDVYAGAIPQTAGKNLFPSSKSEAEFAGVYGGENAVQAHNGSPTASTGFSGVGSFLADKGYQPGGDFDVRPSVEMTGKTVNPDDIHESV